MNKIAKLGQRIFFGVMAATVSLSTLAPALVSADTVTGRSIGMSSSSPSAGAIYNVKFTAQDAAGAFVVDFCKNSPLIGQSCTATGINASGATTTTPGFDATGATNSVVVAGAITASQNVSVELSGINNPNVTGQFYARIVTYDTEEHALAHTPDALATGKLDDGSVALAITDTVGVSGSVLETLKFCVSKEVIAADCASTVAPVLVLGEETAVGSGVVALAQGKINEGTLYTQITTNAVNGAVVYLKNSTTDCGGLLRAGATGATGCNIAPALNPGAGGGLSALDGSAKFGVKTSTAAPAAGITTNGTFQPVSTSWYNNDTYAMNFVSENATGVTSAFGDPFLDTNSAPINNMGMALTFGATVGNNTPAGTYSADIGLIATGKF